VFLTELMNATAVPDRDGQMYVSSRFDERFIAPPRTDYVVAAQGTRHGIAFDATKTSTWEIAAEPSSRFYDRQIFGSQRSSERLAYHLAFGPNGNPSPAQPTAASTGLQDRSPAHAFHPTAGSADPRDCLRQCEICTWQFLAAPESRITPRRLRHRLP
jgi:hypothetical protein